ncbi:MAG: DUF4397 domain-containing protein [Brumimicrobium sp.]
MKNFTLLISSLLAGTMAIGQARVQAIHNCPDPMAGTVDVYLDSDVVFDDISYQEASPYIDAPFGTLFTLYVCNPSASNDATYDPTTDNSLVLYEKDFTLNNGQAYVIVASGGLAETGATEFDLRSYTGQEGSTTAGNTDLNIIHSSYDAPEVNVYDANNATVLVPGFEFGDDTDYMDIPANNYGIQVRLMDNTVVESQFSADLTGFADESVIVLATGYADPGSAVGTEPFGLMAVAEDGTVTLLPTEATTPARLQAIHNSAAQDASAVDVYLNAGATPLLNNFEFRTASAFMDAPAGESFNLAVAPENSASVGDAIYDEDFLLESSKTYIVVASGIIGSGNYDPNTPFELIPIEDAREEAENNGKVDVLIYHGSTDAPTVDVEETLVPEGPLATSISYGEAQGYVELDPQEHLLSVISTGTTIDTYEADLTALADSAITVLASGFFDPAVNEDGSVFGLWVAFASGGDLLELNKLANLNDNGDLSELSVYPNPVTKELNVSFENIGGKQNISIVDMLGKVVYESTISKSSTNTSIDVSQLNNGVYTVNVNSSNGVSSRRIVVNK